jgi:hypothetical protein
MRFLFDMSLRGRRFDYGTDERRSSAQRGNRPRNDIFLSSVIYTFLSINSLSRFDNT